MKLRPEATATIVTDDARTVFVVGNGPSLSGFDFSQLQSHDWVGMNAAYRYWERSEIYPTFYACLDLTVGLSHQDAIIDMVERAETLQIKSFLLRDNLISQSKRLQTSPYVVNYDRHFESFPERVRALVTTGSHSALWMHTLGYDQIILLGIDVNYVEYVAGAQSLAAGEGSNKLKILSEEENENYFFKDYQRVDDVFTVPNPEPDVHKAAWRRVAVYTEAGRAKTKLYNASNLSELDCIDFISISDFLSTGRSDIETVYKHMEKRALEREYEAGVEGVFTQSTLSNFLHKLLPIQYSPMLIQEDLGHIAFSGWTSRALELGKITEWSGVYIDCDFYLQHAAQIAASGFVVLEVHNPVDTERLINRLFKDFDGVYELQNLDGVVQLSQHPTFQSSTPDYIIAFARQRFWPQTIKAALESVISEKYGRTVMLPKLSILKRGVRYFFKSLKTKLGM